MDVLSTGAFAVATATGCCLVYLGMKLAQLRAAHELLQQRLKAEHERVTTVSQQSVDFMKIVHSKWDHEDEARGLKKADLAGTVETSTPT